MSNDIFVITEQMDGFFSDISFEMVCKAREIAATWGGQAVAIVLGNGVASMNTEEITKSVMLSS